MSFAKMPPCIAMLVLLHVCLVAPSMVASVKIKLIGSVTTAAVTEGNPRGIFVEATTGAILFTMQTPHKLQRLHLNGTVQPIAGSGTAGYANGVGVSATFGSPTGIAVSTSNPDDAFVADYDGHCLRRVNLSTFKVVTLVGICGSPGSVDGGPAVASFRNPAGIVLVRNATTGLEYLYVADFTNVLIRRVEIDPVDVVRFAGTVGAQGTAGGYRLTVARFYSPFDVAVDPSGKWLYVIDYYHDCVRRIDATGNGIMTTVAGICGGSEVGMNDGVGSAALFADPRGLAISDDGSVLFAADTRNCAVRRTTVSDWRTLTVSGFARCGAGLVNGRLSAASFGEVYGIKPFVQNVSGAREEGVVVTDFSSNAIRRVSMKFVTQTYSISNSVAVSASTSMSRPSLTGTPTLIPPRTPTASWSHSPSIMSSPTPSNRLTPSHSVSPRGRTSSVSGSVTFTRSDSATNAASTSPTASPSMVRASVSVTASRAPSLSVSSTVGPSATANRSLSKTHVDSTSVSYAASRTVSWSRGGGSLSMTTTSSATDNRLSSSLTVSLSVDGPTQSATVSAEAATLSPSGTIGAPTATCTLPATTTEAHTVSASTSRPTASATNRSSVSRSLTISTTHVTNGRRLQPTFSISDSGSYWSCGAEDERNVSFSGVSQADLSDAPIVSQRAIAVALPEQDNGPPPPPAVAFAVTAAPLPREALLAFRREDLPLLLLSVSMHPRWAVVSVSSLRHNEVLTYNASTLWTPTLRKDLVALRPPLSSLIGWLPEGLSVYASTTIELELTVVCAAEGGNTSGRVATLRVTIPAPGAPRVLAERVETVAATTLWATAAVAPGAGSAVGRVGAVRSIMLCGVGDGPSGGGLLSVQVQCAASSCDEDANAELNCVGLAQARGAVVGNSGILVSSAAFFLVFGAIYAAAAKVSLFDASQRLVVPSVLMPVWIATLPSTAAGTAELLVGGVGYCSTDGGIAALGVLVCAAPVVWIGYVASRLVPQLGLHVAAHPAAGESGTVSRVLRYIFRPNVRWEPSAPANPQQEHLDVDDIMDNIMEVRQQQPIVADHRTHRARQAQLLLHEYRILWYAAVDAGVLVVSGFLSAVSGVGSQSLCTGAAGAITALYAMQLVLCAACNPFTNRFAHVHALATLALSSTSVGLQIGGMLQTSQDAASLERQDALSVASSLCDLFVVGISVWRVIIDGVSCCRAVVRIAREMCCGARPTHIGCSGDAPPHELSSDQKHHGANPPSSPLIEPPLSLPNLEAAAAAAPSSPLLEDTIDELCFWDATGNALPLHLPAVNEANASSDNMLLSNSLSFSAVVPMQWSSDLDLAFQSKPIPPL